MEDLIVIGNPSNDSLEKKKKISRFTLLVSVWKNPYKLELCKDSIMELQKCLQVVNLRLQSLYFKELENLRTSMSSILPNSPQLVPSF